MSNANLPVGFKQPPLLSGLDGSEAILVGFSGGADSTALLHILSRYSKDSGCRICAAHINHGIRGEEADRDEEFCRVFAQKLGIELFVLHADVPTIAKQSGESIETAARRVRYDYFAKIMREQDIKILATAHNANDNLETLIFNIARGSGLGGMCGIPDSRPTECGVVIRPILSMEKSEILEYCEKNSLDFVTDSTNTNTDYTRNLIRAKIIPIMQEINSGAVKNAQRTCENLREDSLCLESMAGWFVEELRDGYAIEIEKISGSPASVVNRALIRLFDEISGGKTLEQTHLNSLKELARKGVPHSSVSLPCEFEGVIESGKLYLRKKAKKEAIDYYETELFDGSNFISQTNSEIVIGNSQNAKNIYKKSTILYIDSAKIRGTLKARQRRAGDRIRLGGMSKSVKKLMCDKKIPLELREKLPVICDEDGIVAIPLLATRDGAVAKNNSNATVIQFYLH